MIEPERDMSRLTQRELLILLNERVGKLNEKLERVSIGHYALKDEVNSITIRNKTLSAMWGVFTVLITLFINAFKIFR